MGVLLRRPTRALAIFFIAVVALFGISLNASPAKANVLTCGSGPNYNSVVQSNYHGYFWIWMTCYHSNGGMILMAAGDSVVYASANSGGDLRIDPRTACRVHLWTGQAWTVTNTNYGGVIWQSLTDQNTEYVDYCYGI